MADELRISGIFDVSGILEGTAQASESIASLAGPVLELGEKAEATATQASNMAVQFEVAAKGAQELKEASAGIDTTLSSKVGGASFGVIGQGAGEAVTQVQLLTTATSGLSVA